MEDGLWKRIQAELRNTNAINIGSYDTWIRPTRQLASENGNRKLLVGVPTQEFADMILDKFQDPILETCRKLGLLGTAIESIEYKSDWKDVYEMPGGPRRPVTPAPLPVEEQPGEEVDLPKLENCPSVPEECWFGLAKQYRELTMNNAEASDNFHFVCFLVAAAATIGRLVYIEEPAPNRLYLNIFTVLVGESGDGKNVAQEFCRTLYSGASDLITTMNRLNSAEGFVSLCARVVQDPRKADSSLVIKLTEFRSFIEKANQKGLGELVPTLCDAYDSEKLETNTKLNHTSVEKPPLVCLLAGTTPAWMTTLKETDIEGGLGNRIIFVPGDAKPPRSRCRPPDLSAMSAELKTVREFWEKRGHTKLILEPEADRLWDRWYIKRPDLNSNLDPLIRILTKRFRSYVLKVAGIWAYLDRSERIAACHLKAAITFIDFLFVSLNTVFCSFGMSKWAQEQAKILEKVKKCPRRRMNWRRLQQHFSRMDAKQFSTHLYWLDKAGRIAIEPRGWQELPGTQRTVIFLA